MTTAQKKKIVFITCCIDDWGGSEDLWAKAIPFLIEQGATVSVCKAGIKTTHPQFVKLASTGVSLKELKRPSYPYGKNLLLRVLRKMGVKMARVQLMDNELYFGHYLEESRPGLVVICQGINFDGWKYGEVCREQRIPFALVAQKGVNFYWPDPVIRDSVKNVYRDALKCFFVSHHNKQLTEEQCGMRLEKAAVIYNPLKIPRSALAYPSTKNGYKLACIGRLFIIDKGQDILLRILAKPYWRQQNLSISFIGSGPDKKALEEMACLLNVQNIEFIDYTDDITNIWREHHALVLPSRSEGMPLVLIEAMAAGRPVIVTEAGGSAEIVTEGITGFMGQATEKSFEAALQKAWDNRHDWETIGKNAATKIIQDIPDCPERIFANQINELLDE